MGRNRQYGGFNVYRGSRRQIGGGIFSTIGRFLRPIASKILPSIGRAAKTALKEVGKSALTVGAQTAQDVLQGKSVGESFKTRAQKEAKRQAGRAVRHVGRRMRGRGLRRSISLDCQVGSGGGGSRKRTRSKSSKRKKPIKRRRQQSIKRKRSTSRKAVGQRRRRRQTTKKRSGKRQRDIFD